MTAMGYGRRENRAPALAAAVVLHVALLIAVLFLGKSPPLPTGTAVPINIVANGPTTDSRPAIQAPVEQTARVETPVPDAKPPEPAPPPSPQPKAAQPQPAPPRPQPRVAEPQPAPPQLAPSPKPAPTHVKPKQFDLSAVAAEVGAKPQPKSFNLNSLQADVAQEAKAHPSHQAFAEQGLARSETAHAPRVAAAMGISQSDIEGLQGLLQRLWNPDCSNEEKVIIPVKFTVGFDGRVLGRVDAGGRENSSDPVVFAAARRAIDAVHQAAPYADTYRGLPFTINFNAKKACAAKE
jgi:outer membrane biosynthesis protein TonB